MAPTRSRSPISSITASRPWSTRSKAKSDLWLDDVDIFFPYDGFTIITVAWFENVGYCPAGGATKFLADNWDADHNRIVIDGRVPVNPHGGSLSEGATRGTGHLREAVVQLRGEAGDRQVPGVRTGSSPPAGSSSTRRARSSARCRPAVPHVEVDGAALDYEIDGPWQARAADVTTIVFAHGGEGTHRHWWQQVASLASASAASPTTCVASVAARRSRARTAPPPTDANLLGLLDALGH